MKMKKLHSVIAAGCLVGALVLSSANSAFAMEGVEKKDRTSAETESVSGETETPEESKKDVTAQEIPEESKKDITAGEIQEESKGDVTDQNDQAAQVMSYSDGSTAEDPASLAAYLSEDPTQPQEAITLTAETGAVIDGYELNHNQVKILNINTGNITLGPDTYSQENGDAETPWDARSDAYVIRGKGNSPNNITVSSPQVKITIYLMDLEWNGTIKYSQDTELELVVCGEVVNHSNFITSAQKEKLKIKGLTADGNSVRTDGYIFSGCNLNSLSLENVTLAAKELGNVPSTQQLSYSVYCNDVMIDHASVTNMVVRRSASVAGPGIVIKNNSEVKNLYTYDDSASFTNTIQVSDSKLDNSRNYICTSVANARFTLLNIYKIIATNSVLNIQTSPVTTLEADKCTIEVQGNLAFKNLIANLCSIKGDFVGTAVDYEAHDLFLKILRLREHPNEYVTVSVDGGESARLLTDLNGSIYPYVKAGSTAITVTAADGTTYSTTFDPVAEDDENTIILTPGGSSGGGEGGGEGGGDIVDTDAPKITDTSLHDVYVNAGDTFSLAVAATSQTKPADLSYQWYKDGQLIDTNKGKKKTYSVTIAKAEHTGVYYCKVTDNNNGKTAVSKEVYVSVYAPADPKAPVIMGQSSSMELVAGSSVTLSVNARPFDTRSGLTFQWYKGTTELAGEISRTLKLTKIKAGDAGSYHCVVTDDLLGTTTESSATVINVK